MYLLRFGTVRPERLRDTRGTPRWPKRCTGSRDDRPQEWAGGVVDEDVEDHPRVGSHETAGGIDPARSLPEGRVARVGHEQGPAPIEGQPERAVDRDIALGVLLRAREPERFGTVGIEDRELVLREEGNVEPAGGPEGDPPAPNRGHERAANQSEVGISGTRRHDEVGIPVELLEVGGI